MRRPTCIAFDFDRTLADYNDNLDGLVDIFRHPDITEQQLVAAFHEVGLRGFSFDKLLDTLHTTTGLEFDVRSVVDACNEWLERSIRLYDGVSEFFESFGKEIPLAIVTFGNEAFQRQKIKAVGLHMYPVYVTDTLGTKGMVLRELLALHGGSLLFVDDNPLELDPVAALFSEEAVQTSYIDHLGEHPKGSEMAQKHMRFESISDIASMLQNE